MSQVANAFELVLIGFDGSSDDTDDLVIWVGASSMSEVTGLLESQGCASSVSGISQLPADADVDFALPGQLDELVMRIAELTARCNSDDVLPDVNVSDATEVGAGVLNFEYQLLGRLQQDCEYYLGFGQRNKKRLWAQGEVEQIQKMKELYAALPEKPTWITLADIERYELAMLGSGVE